MLLVRPQKRYAQPIGSSTVKWRGRVEVLLDSVWLFTTEVSVVSRNDGKGLFVAGPERKMPDGGYFKQVRFGNELQEAMLIAIKSNPDPVPTIDDPAQSMRRRESQDGADEFSEI